MEYGVWMAWEARGNPLRNTQVCMNIHACIYLGAVCQEAQCQTGEAFLQVVGPKITQVIARALDYLPDLEGRTYC